MKKKLIELWYKVADRLHLGGDIRIDVNLKELSNGTIGITGFQVKVKPYRFVRYRVVRTFNRSIDAVNFINDTLGLSKELQVKRIGKKH